MRSNSLNTNSGFYYKLNVSIISLYFLIGGLFPFNLYANGICDRNPIVQRGIIGALTSGGFINIKPRRFWRRKVCKDIAEAELQKIELLILHRTGLTDLSRKDLAGLINLKILDLR